MDDPTTDEKRAYFFILQFLSGPNDQGAIADLPCDLMGTLQAKLMNGSGSMKNGRCIDPMTEKAFQADGVELPSLIYHA